LSGGVFYSEPPCMFILLFYVQLFSSVNSVFFLSKVSVIDFDEILGVNVSWLV